MLPNKNHNTGNAFFYLYLYVSALFVGETFEVGDRARVKLNKGKLDKRSTPNSV